MKKDDRSTRTKVDFHLHSNLSDGENTVDEIIQSAYLENMRAIAISDHNTFAIKERIIVGENPDYMEVIPACEFSTTYFIPEKRETAEVHVIGLFPHGIDPNQFSDIFAACREGKIKYIRAVLQKLDTLNIHLELPEVLREQRDSGHIGRHQIASVLIKKGYVKTVDQAFDLYLGNYSDHYVSPVRYIAYANFHTIIQRIRHLNGFPILCHPFGYSFSKEQICTLVAKFSQACENKGGLEVYYEKYIGNFERLEFLKQLQETYRLTASVASDRHREEDSFASGGDAIHCARILQAISEV